MRYANTRGLDRADGQRLQPDMSLIATLVRDSPATRQQDGRSSPWRKSLARRPWRCRAKPAAPKPTRTLNSKLLDMAQQVLLRHARAHGRPPTPLQESDRRTAQARMGTAPTARAILGQDSERHPGRSGTEGGGQQRQTTPTGERLRQPIATTEDDSDLGHSSGCRRRKRSDSLFATASVALTTGLLVPGCGTARDIAHVQTDRTGPKWLVRFLKLRTG